MADDDFIYTTEPVTGYQFIGAITDDLVKRAHVEMERLDLWHTTSDGYDVGMGATEDDARAILTAALTSRETGDTK